MDKSDLKDIQNAIAKFNLDINDFEFTETNWTNPNPQPTMFVISGEIKIRYKPSNVEKTYATGTTMSSEPVFPDNFFDDIANNFYRTR